MTQTSEEVLDRHKGKEFEHEGWHGVELTSEGTPMVDDGTGKPLVLRTFEFAVKPTAIGTPRPNNSELFNFHWPQLRALIWNDGLVANKDVPPRVVISKTRYRIFILCEPKFGNMVVDRPDTLQKIFKKKK